MTPAAGASRLLGILGRHARPLLAGGIFLGLLLPETAAFFRPWIPLAVLTMLTANFLRLPAGALRNELRRPVITLAILLWVLIALPIMVWAVLSLLPLADDLANVVLLATGAPPILSGSAVAILLGLDGALAMMAVLAATMAVPFILPPLALLLIDIELTLGTGALMARLAALVGLALLLAAAVRRLKGPAWVESRGQELDGLVVLAMLVFALGIMDGVAAAIAADAQRVAFWLLVVFAANLLMQLAGALAFLPLGCRSALTVGLISGHRNLGLLVAALPGGGGPAMLLYAALGQVPIYVSPALMGPLYRRILRIGKSL